MIKLSTANLANRAIAVLVVITVLTLLLVALPGCSSDESDSSHLKIVVLPYLDFAPFYIAQEEGYFAEQGIDAEFVKFSTSTQAIPLLAQGSLDVVAGSISASLINAIVQNMNLRIVAGRDYYSPDCEGASLMVRKDLYDSGELDTVAEIKGRQVAVSCIGCLGDFALAQIIENAGLDFNNVGILKMSPQDAIVAFGNGAIGAALVSNPQIEQIKSLDYAVTLESFSNLTPGFQLAFIMFGPNLLEKNPEMGKKFMAAYLQGARQYAQGKTERNVEIIEKHTGLDRQTILQTCWNLIYVDGQIRVNDVLSFQDWVYENGFVDGKVSEEQLFDTRFVEYANKILGPAP